MRKKLLGPCLSCGPVLAAGELEAKGERCLGCGEPLPEYKVKTQTGPPKKLECAKAVVSSDGHAEGTALTVLDDGTPTFECSRCGMRFKRGA
jgi:hypothetical protein